MSFPDTGRLDEFFDHTRMSSRVIGIMERGEAISVLPGSAAPFVVLLDTFSCELFCLGDLSGRHFLFNFTSHLPRVLSHLPRIVLP